MLITNKVKIKWNSKNKDYYEKLGYTYTKMKDEFEIPIEHLSSGSKYLVNIKCDYCNNNFNREYRLYLKLKEKSNIKMDCCKNCKSIKSKEAFIDKYGVYHPMLSDKSDEIKKKVINTNLNKYGVENVSQSDIIKQKKIQSYIKNFGSYHPMHNDNVKQKLKNTNLNKYGVENVYQSDFVKQKTKQTNLEKYGVEYISQSNEIKEKINKSFYKRGTMSCSKQQKYLHDLLGGELNYPVSRCSLDIAFIDQNIYLEYNGGGHYVWDNEDIIKSNDLNRYRYLKSLGWKCITIVSKKDYLPTDEDILSLINKCKEYLKKYNWVEINIDNNSLILKDHKEELSINTLQKI